MKSQMINFILLQKDSGYKNNCCLFLLWLFKCTYQSFVIVLVLRLCWVSCFCFIETIDMLSFGVEDQR